MNEKDLQTLILQVMQETKAKKAPASGASLRTVSTVTLALAKRVAARVEEEAARIGVNAVVAIADHAGRPILIEAMDDAFMASYDVALQKAYTVTALKMSTGDLKPLAQPNGPLYGIQFTNDCHIVIFGGGEPLKVHDAVVGGLGVSGGSEEQDTALAAYGRRVFEELILA